MNNDKDFNKLTDHILTPMERWTAASNLNAIERERERQKNPSVIDYVLMLLASLAAFPGIIYCAYDFLSTSSTAVEIIFIIVAALVALWIDVMIIKVCWVLLFG